MFSGRVPARLEPNDLALALSARRRQGRPLLDLTRSNPTSAGFAYPKDLLAPLGDPAGLEYAPAPFGLVEARCAVAADCARRGRTVAVEDILLTASTSDAYSLTFKLLCDPGDEILVPRPSYPLFEYLTRLDAVASVPYALEYHGRWSIDVGGVERACTTRTRALLIVNPNNPTGSFVSAAELDALAAICAPRGIAIISDEVFTDYALREGAAAQAGSLVGHDDVLGFTLGGLSKSVGLPQAKLAWAIISGPASLVGAARQRLELIADTYLSVSTPVQVAAARLLDNGAAVRAQILERVTTNVRQLRALAESVPSCRVLDVDGGWYAVIQVPSLVPEEELVLRLLDEDNVLVHPGFFFDFPHESFVIVSLLPPPAEFVEASSRLLRRCGGTHA